MQHIPSAGGRLEIRNASASGDEFGIVSERFENIGLPQRYQHTFFVFGPDNNQVLDLWSGI